MISNLRDKESSKIILHRQTVYRIESAVSDYYYFMLNFYVGGMEINSEKFLNRFTYIIITKEGFQNGLGK